MDRMHYHDGNVYNLLDSRYTHRRHDVDHKLQMHSSLIRRLSLERELEGHDCCVNALAWNSSGSLLISGSDDTLVNIWSYTSGKLLHSVDTWHSDNVFCTKFVPETSDELVVSGGRDADVRLFNLTRLNVDADAIEPYACCGCHTEAVKNLVVEVGNPNVFWSASEDGTLRQHDLREAISCPSSVSSPQDCQCRNVLLDLRSAAKRSLTDPPKETLALKSCDISSTRPHLLIVGGSDAFARLYDRRMLPPLTSCRIRPSPPQCVNYFCPLHLSKRVPSALHLTHVAFSPDGKEVLLSYSQEHVYLMDVNQGSEVVQYTPGDVEKLLTFTPTLETLDPKAPNVRPKSFLRKCGVARLDKCRKLVGYMRNSLETATNIYHAIEACNEFLDGDNSDIDRSLRRDCLCVRAALLLKRKWKNDVHMAIRDCQNARRIDSSKFEAHYYMSEALQQIGKHKEARDFAILAQRVAPSNVIIAEKLAERLASIEKDLTAAKKRKKTTGEPRSDPRTLRDLPVSDLVYRSKSNNDASRDMPRSETDDSDYDGESEVEIGTSMPGVDLNILHGSFNLRHRRGESTRENAGSIGSCGSPSWSSQNDRTQYQPEGAVDMKQRYVGHCNIGTDIKQASFLGQRGEYIASGSDDGRWFIWEKRTGRLVKMLIGDELAVNCIQPHPFDCAVATSGMHDTIKIWTPNASVPSIISGESPGPETTKVLKAMDINLSELEDTSLSD